jgi:hypothetical protein
MCTTAGLGKQERQSWLLWINIDKGKERNERRKRKGEKTMTDFLTAKRKSLLGNPHNVKEKNYDIY